MWYTLFEFLLQRLNLFVIKFHYTNLFGVYFKKKNYFNLYLKNYFQIILFKIKVYDSIKKLLNIKKLLIFCSRIHDKYKVNNFFYIDTHPNSPTLLCMV